MDTIAMPRSWAGRPSIGPPVMLSPHWIKSHPDRAFKSPLVGPSVRSWQTGPLEKPTIICRLLARPKSFTYCQSDLQLTSIFVHAFVPQADPTVLSPSLVTNPIGSSEAWNPMASTSQSQVVTLPLGLFNSYLYLSFFFKILCWMLNPSQFY